jgi:hypothetical protein
MLDRLMGVITLKAPIYKSIAEDKTATTSAAIIVVIATLVSGFFTGLVKLDPQTQTTSISIGGAFVGAILGVIFGLVAWVFTAWVLQFVAKMFGGKTDTGEMLRVTGFVEVFSLVSVLNIAAIVPVLACVTGIIGLVAAILRLIGYVIGVREAAEFSTGNAVITAIIAAIVNFIIVVVIFGAITTFVLLALGLAGGLSGG